MLFLPEKRRTEECLEGAVDERGMKPEVLEFVDDHRRNGHLGDGPVLSGGHALNRSERGAVIESDGLGAGVEIITADRGGRLSQVRRALTARGRRNGVEFRGRGDPSTWYPRRPWP